MNTYLISYDLRAPGRNYDDLYDEIKSMGAWWHNLESTWLVHTTSTTSQIRDRLKAKVDPNDKILVVKASQGWATFGFSAKANDWLREYL